MLNTEENTEEKKLANAIIDELDRQFKGLVYDKNLDEILSNLSLGPQEIKAILSWNQKNFWNKVPHKKLDEKTIDRYLNVYLLKRFSRINNDKEFEVKPFTIKTWSEFSDLWTNKATYDMIATRYKKTDASKIEVHNKKENAKHSPENIDSVYAEALVLSTLYPIGNKGGLEENKARYLQKSYTSINQRGPDLIGTVDHLIQTTFPQMITKSLFPNAQLEENLIERNIHNLRTQQTLLQSSKKSCLDYFKTLSELKKHSKKIISKELTKVSLKYCFGRIMEFLPHSKMAYDFGKMAALLQQMQSNMTTHSHSFSLDRQRFQKRDAEYSYLNHETLKKLFQNNPPLYLKILKNDYRILFLI